jgi:hypothetical protein
MQDNPEERWMTFAELADARGISRESAIRLIRKKRWRRQRDNRGNVIALIPGPWADPPDRPADDPADRPADDREERPGDPDGFHTKALATLDTAVATLREQLVRAEARADSAESDRRRADALIANLEADLRAKDAQIGRAESEASEQRTTAEQADARAKDAIQAAEALRQAEEARKARGRWTRLRAAWRRE